MVRDLGTRESRTCSAIAAQLPAVMMEGDHFVSSAFQGREPFVPWITASFDLPGRCGGLDAGFRAA